MILDRQLFDGMMINPYGDDWDFEEHKPQISKAFGGLSKVRRVDIDRICKYVMYMYDVRSPMRKHINDMAQRKKECAILAGYDLSKSRDSKKAESLFDFSDKDITALIINFLRYQNNKTWSLLVSNEEVLYQYNSELLQNASADKDKEKLQALEIKSKLMNECDKIVERIEAYEEKIYGQDPNLIQASRDVPVTPEQIANV